MPSQPLKLTMKSTLFLLPNILHPEASFDHWIPKGVYDAAAQIDGLIAEDEKRGRHYLMRFAFDRGRTFREIPIKVFSEHQNEQSAKEILSSTPQGQKWGFVTDCGLPCIADPGHLLVKEAKKQGWEVRAFAGPNALILALMLSGLNAQRFSFHGYLPQKVPECIAKIQWMSKAAAVQNSTQAFIETPYRAAKLFELLLAHLDPKVQLCVAIDLTAPSQQVFTMAIKEWKLQKEQLTFNKNQVIFLVSS